MANKFKTEEDCVYRVIGIYFELEADFRESQGLPRYKVVNGPYASRTVARGQRTAEENAQDWRVKHYNQEPRFERYEIQECVPTWTTIAN